MSVLPQQKHLEKKKKKSESRLLVAPKYVVWGLEKELEELSKEGRTSQEAENGGGF